MLQKIFLFSLFFLLFGTRVFANEDINISVNTENISENQKIAEIKGLRNYEIPSLLKIIFGIIFFSIFYLFLKKYFFPEGVKAVSEIPKHILERRRKIELFIQSLEYNYETLSDKDFRIKILSGLRQIFISEGIQNIHKQTLSELELNKNFSQHGLENIYREIYFAEYAEKNIERDTRKKYLESIKKYVTELGK